LKEDNYEEACTALMFALKNDKNVPEDEKLSPEQKFAAYHNHKP
jgi:hypothetical protein